MFRVATEEAAAKVVLRFRSNPASRCPARSRSQRHGSSVRASPVKSHRRCAARSPSRPARRCPGRSASRLPSKCRARSNASAGGRSAKWPEAVAEEDTEVVVVVMANKHSTQLHAAYTLDIHFDRSRPMQDKSIYFVVLLFYLLVAKEVKDVFTISLVSSHFCNTKTWF